MQAMDTHFGIRRRYPIEELSYLKHRRENFACRVNEHLVKVLKSCGSKAPDSRIQILRDARSHLYKNDPRMAPRDLAPYTLMLDMCRFRSGLERSVLTCPKINSDEDLTRHF